MAGTGDFQAVGNFMDGMRASAEKEVFFMKGISGQKPGISGAQRSEGYYP
jgi:hypothetical protein